MIPVDMEGCVTLPIDDGELKDVILQAKDYLCSHGIVLRTPEAPLDPEHVTHAPVTLLPSAVPTPLYMSSQHVQNDINLLMHKIAHDYDFMKQCLENVIKVDDFTRNLWEIYEKVTKEGISQPYSLGLNRTDYMFDYRKPTTEVISSEQKVDTGKTKLKMIEINLMASSFGGLCQQIEGFHRFILERFKCFDKLQKLPANPGIDILAKGMVSAWKQYNSTQSVILFLITFDERNLYDQRFLEYAIYKHNPKVKVIRRTMKDIQDRAELKDDKRLMLDGYEVSVVYQRALYTPQDYTSQKDWDTRLLIERSRAIKCPSAGYHLAGTKKVQQVLAKPGVVEKYIQDPEAVARIRNTFAGQYSLDLDSEGDKSVAMAMDKPHLYVLKPQREGGGNNTFGEEIRQKLSEIQNSSERTAYILMEHIHPAPVQTYMIRSGQPVELHHCVSELGVFGAFVGTKDNVILNESGGHILRTKTVGTDEGGVATGFSCLDSPYLVD